MSIYKDIIYHNHHIIPRHAGGTDDESNLIKLTIEEHAAAHKTLYEEHGRWQDKLAWEALSGMIGRDEVLLQSITHSGERNPMYGKTHTEETRQKISDNINEKQWWVGKVHSDETKSKMSHWRKNYWEDNFAAKEKLSSLRKGIPRPKIVCPHCDKQGGVGIMNRWHFDNCKSKA